VSRDASAPEPVSVVVCNYQGAGHLPHCLPALRAQTVRPDELIVVDNASTDGSAELARELAPEARVERLAQNRGPGPARNRGLELARNRWVLLVDNDAVPAPDCLERLLAARRPGAVLVQPRSVFDDEPDRVHYDGGRFHYAGLFSLRNFGLPLAEALGRGVVEVDGAVSVALLVDREQVLAAGGFDPRFFILFEDLDLSYRLRLEGHAILSVEEALVRHRAGTAGISFREASKDSGYPARRAFLHSRNRWIFLLKNYRLATLLVAAPGLALYELAQLAFALREGHPLAWVRGKLALLAGLGPTLAARSAVQRRRRRTDRELLVVGPLTIHPQLGRERRAVVLLDRALACWWRLVRHLAG
jgi:GT2 family glycosyltransferase